MTRRLRCSETFAGSGKTATVVEVPGVRAWVHSVPAGRGPGSGDVHYLSLCPDCVVSRVALADVSGHGQGVAVLGEALRSLLQKYLPDLEHAGLMRDLNRAVRDGLDGVHYATMVAAGWDGTKGLLVVMNAGHPPPCWYRASREEWAWLDTPGPRARARPAGTPLGLLPDVEYDRTVVEPRPGDLLLMYTDGLSEATNPAGEELGREGLLGLAREVDCSSAEAFGTGLGAALRRYRAGVVPADDATMIVLEWLASEPRPV